MDNHIAVTNKWLLKLSDISEQCTPFVAAKIENGTNREVCSCVEAKCVIYFQSVSIHCRSYYFQSVILLMPDSIWTNNG